MLIDENYLEPILKRYFQKNVSFFINGEEIKSGIFILYSLSTYSNNYFIEFHIRREKKIDIIKIPYPFSIEEHDDDGLIYLDYRLSTLCKNKTHLIKKIEKVAQSIASSSDNKFYNNILEIQFS